MRKWLVILGVLIGGVILGVIGLMSFFYFFNPFPVQEVKNGTDLDEYAVKYLKDHNLIQEGEVVLLYYDYTLVDDGTEASILTNKRIIYHCNTWICEGLAEERPRTDSILLRNIVDIRLTMANDMVGRDTIRIVGGEGKEMLIKIDPTAIGPSFGQTLITTWELTKTKK